MTREEKIKSLTRWCISHACDSKHCQIYDLCQQAPTGDWSKQADEFIDKVYVALCEGEDKIIDYIKDEMKCQMVEGQPGVKFNIPQYHEVTKMINERRDQKAKADAGKAEIRLVPMEIVWAIAWIRMYGNRKYGDPENWKTVEPERYRDALMRHLLHYISDPESVDEESGYPHLWHAACNMAFLMHFDYGYMCCYDFAVKAPEWEKIGKTVENNRISPSKELHELGESLRKEIDKAIYKKSYWTPCSLKLPDKEGEYLVTNDAGGMKNVEIDTFAHYEDDGKPFWMISQNPIAWMPIPDVYEKKEVTNDPNETV